MNVFSSLWEFLTGGLDLIVDVIQYVTTLVTAIPRGVFTLNYYISQLPPFITPFLTLIVGFCVAKTIVDIAK